MDEYIVRRGIPRLSLLSAMVLYLRCTTQRSIDSIISDINSDPQLRKYFEKSPSVEKNTVNWHLGRAYEALHIGGIDEVNQDFCRMFHEVAGNPPDWDSWPPSSTVPLQPAPSAVVRNEEVEHRELQVEDGPFWQRHFTRFQRIAGAMIALVGIAVLGFLIFGNGGEPPGDDLDTSDGTEGIGQIAPGESPTEETQPQETPAASPVVLTSATNTLQPTETPTITLTPSITPTPTDTPTPTSTSTPTLTPTPTEAPTETPTPLFFDDFSSGYSDQWDVLQGEPFVVNQTLTFNSDTVMVIDADWSDYVVSFKASNFYCQQVVTSRDVAIGLRYQDLGNMIAVRLWHYSYCGAGWWTVESGTWEMIQNSHAPLPGGSQFRITVSGNTFSVSGGNEIFLDTVATGGVALIASEGMIIDDFKVEAIN